ENFKIAFNLDSFNSAFVIHPTNGIPFFTSKHQPSSGANFFTNRDLCSKLKEAYEIQGDYKKIFMKPMYFGKINSMEIYKMIPMKDMETKFYDGKVIERTGEPDPNVNHESDDKS
ncbi:unnamed protein product, partial [marine sediment metagenome]